MEKENEKRTKNKNNQKAGRCMQSRIFLPAFFCCPEGKRQEILL